MQLCIGLHINLVSATAKGQPKFISPKIWTDYMQQGKT